MPGVEADAGAAAALLHVADDAVDVRRGLPVDVDDVAASLDEALHLLLRLDDHQVYVERDLGRAADRLDDGHADGDRRNEAAVHDVDVEHLRTGGLDFTHLVRQP